MTFTDLHGDIFGYAFLRLPAVSLVPGEPLTLKVAGETPGSRVWYMTFQSPVEEGMDIAPRQALIRRENRLFQPVDVHIVHLGEPTEVELAIPDGPRIIQKIEYGFNRIEMVFPEVARLTESSLYARFSDGEPMVRKFVLEPVRKWYVYLVQHTHTDIGYTRPQTEILPEHLRFIDYALDFCDLTDHLPA